MTDKEITKLLDLIATQHTRIAELEQQLAELNSPVQLSEWQKMEQQLAELREAARELTLPIRVVCCHCSHSTMWIPDTPEALQEEGK